MDFSYLLILAALLAVVRVLRLVYNFFLRPGKNLKAYGEWAVVTGATDGIGKAYAFELASKGLNVLLVARSEEKLAEVAKELSSKHSNVKVDTAKVDFSNFSSSDRTDMKAKLKPLDVGVLVNNVGLSYPFTKYFHELTDAEAGDIMEVNIASTTWMTKAVLGEADQDGKVLDGMLSRRRGAIVNTSSAAARATSPLLAEYSGAKSYVEMFTKGLAAELKPKGIDVQVQTPLYVTTKMAKIHKTSITVPSPKKYVSCAVRQIGYGAVISPYWAHSLQLWVLSLLPEFVGVMILDTMHQDIRRRGMKKEKAKREAKTD